MLGVGEVLLSLLSIVFIIGVFALFVQALRNSETRNTPTWNGIIISALLGCLPIYLVLCFFGVMGEEKK
jgi:Na+-driven multidrug efflux pump